MRREPIQALVDHLDAHDLPPVLREKLEAVKAELRGDDLPVDDVPWRHPQYLARIKEKECD